MSLDSVKNYLARFGLDSRIRIFNTSSATVALAAEALGTEEARIAKTISLYNANGGCILIVCAGDYKIDNSAFKGFFGFKAKMLSPDDALAMTGHAVGGVCPFALPEGVEVYLDESLKRFDKVFPAAGTSNSAVELTPDELFFTSGAIAWQTLCRSRDI